MVGVEWSGVSGVEAGAGVGHGKWEASPPKVKGHPFKVTY
jgi:hypothetical protein